MDYEVILVDDGSSDRSGFICDRYQEKHPNRVTVIHQQNQGLLGARITAIKAARGKYCLCMDSDDFWENSCLKRLKHAIDEFSPEMIIFNFNKVVNDKKVAKKPSFSNYRMFSDNKLPLYRCLINSSAINSYWSKLILTELAKDSLKDYDQLSYRIAAEDVVQSLYPITYAKTILYIASPLYNYRIRRDSLTSAALETNWVQYSYLPMRKKIRDYMTIWNCDSPEWMDMYYAYSLSLMSDFFWGTLKRTKNKRIALQYLKQLDYSLFVENEAYQYKRSKYLDLKQKIKIDVILKKKICLLKLYIFHKVR